MKTELRCPICGKKLVEWWRVREERVPSTVPEYFSRSKQAPYRMTDNWVEVKCSNEHWFKRSGDALYGMKTPA